jgi:hypothetical protein
MAVRLSSKHCRAICDEVGIRLRQHLDRTSTAPPANILAQLRALDFTEGHAPSIVPSLEDVDASITTLEQFDGEFVKV